MLALFSGATIFVQLGNLAWVLTEILNMKYFSTHFVKQLEKALKQKFLSLIFLWCELVMICAGF